MLPSEREEFELLLGKLDENTFLSLEEKKALGDYISAEKVLAISKRLAIEKIEEIFYAA